MMRYDSKAVDVQSCDDMSTGGAIDYCELEARLPPSTALGRRGALEGGGAAQGNTPIKGCPSKSRRCRGGSGVEAGVG